MDRYSPFPQKPNTSPPTGFHLSNSPLMKTVALGFFGLTFGAILILLLLLCVYVIIRRRVYLMEPRRGYSSRSRARIRGLDAKLVQVLPTFLYASQNFEGHEKLECTICLSEFEEGEKVRILPNCDHTFHIDCIDMWFSSHSNCPVCRTEVEAHAKAIAINNIEDSCSSNGNNNSVVVVNIGVIEEGQSSGGSPRKSEEISSPNASNCGRFLRLHSLKRMVSRGREEKVFPTSSHLTATESEGQSLC